MEKKIYKRIDLIRVVACIAVFLYHINALKGGYLAVCTFFVLSGYLSCISLFKKEKLSLKDYYINKFKNLYFPLLIVVFITIFVISLIPSITWLNLKPETTSVLLGYNNFWQLNANLDYFTRHISSPFMHFWYIGILLQFDLVFPFIFIILRKIGDKIHKSIPCIILLILSIISSIYFYIESLNPNIMIVYYNTFTRVFSLIFGMLIGFIHAYYKPLVIKNINTIVFYLYLLLIMSLFIFIDASHTYFNIAMLLSTIITCRLIDYGVFSNNKESIFDKVIKSISKISYEVYLIQYPLIFIFQNISMDNTIKMILLVILLILLSYIINFGIKNKKSKLRYIVLIFLLVISSIGIYDYVIAKDHTAEMKALEEQLLENQKIMEQKQEEYALRLKSEMDSLNSELDNIEDLENKLDEKIDNLPIVGVGDSVMLGAVENLYKTFPKGYFDAATSRTAWVLNDILKGLRSKGLLGDPILLNLGANGDCPDWCKAEIMQTSDNRKVFWINATNDSDVHVNERLNKLAEAYDNLYVIDWESISKGHPEYFVVDGIHLTEVGREAYVSAIRDSIYNTYLEEYNKKKEELLKIHDEKQKLKISFYGNDLLLNVYPYLEEDFNNSKFVIDKDFNYETLINKIKEDIKDESINYKVVFVFDKNAYLTKDNYNELIELCKEHEIYILDSLNLKLDSNDITTMEFYKELETNSSYYMPDKVHLTTDGNKALKESLLKLLKNKG